MNYCFKYYVHNKLALVGSSVNDHHGLDLNICLTNAPLLPLATHTLN